MTDLREQLYRQIEDDTSRLNRVVEWIGTLAIGGAFGIFLFAVVTGIGG